jgi:hypothetical protein
MKRALLDLNSCARLETIMSDYFFWGKSGVYYKTKRFSTILTIANETSQRSKSICYVSINLLISMNVFLVNFW